MEDIILIIDKNKSDGWGAITLTIVFAEYIFTENAFKTQKDWDESVFSNPSKMKKYIDFKLSVSSEQEGELISFTRSNLKTFLELSDFVAKICFIDSARSVLESLFNRDNMASDMTFDIVEGYYLKNCQGLILEIKNEFHDDMDILNLIDSFGKWKRSF